MYQGQNYLKMPDIVKSPKFIKFKDHAPSKELDMDAGLWKMSKANITKLPKDFQNP